MPRTGRPARFLGMALAALFVAGVAARSTPAEEAWDAIYIAGHKVGYQHTTVKPLPQKYKDRDLLNVQVNQILTLERGKDVLTMQMRYGTIEGTDGEVYRIDFRTSASQQEQRNFGDIVDGKLLMTYEAGGKTTVQPIEWPAEVRGFYAVEQSNARNPMKPGETRTLKSFLPVINEICTVVLVAERQEPVKLPAGKTLSLLKVYTRITGPDGKPRTDYDQDYWFDSAGQVIKVFSPLLGGIEIYRTTKEAAQAVGGARFDLMEATLLKVNREIPRPEQTREATYRITSLVSGGEDPSQTFPADRRQAVRRESPTVATLTVRTAGPKVGEEGPDSTDAKYLQANPLINSDNSRVVDHMKEAVGNTTDAWERAGGIEHWVFSNLKQKNFTVGFATASEVAQNLEGDCTEHAVLAAAMCRAAGIPSRVAIGLIYAKSLGGFGGHMWTEVYVNRRWVAIDAAFDQKDVDAVHLKLSDSSLDGVSPFDALLPILGVSKRVKVEALEVR